MPRQDEHEREPGQFTDLLPRRITQLVQLFQVLRIVSRKLWVPVQIALALSGLALAGVQGYAWWDQSTKISKRIDTTLQATLDNTVWQHKGMAAYLLANLETQPESALGDASASADTTFILNMTEKHISAQKSQSASARNSDSVIEELGLSVYPPLPKTGSMEQQDKAPSEQALIAGDKSFFLFLPAMGLHRKYEAQYKQLTTEDKRLLADTLTNNPDILSDLYLAKSVKEAMIEKKAQRIGEQSVVQCYFITESNLIVIISPKEPSQQTFYEGLFPTTHNFTDRPYFSKAITNAKKGLSKNGFDYVSEPYIDLGGHGLVKTYSKAFELANRRHGVLCFDVDMGPVLQGQVMERLEVLEADYGWFYYHDGKTREMEFEWPSAQTSEDSARHKRVESEFQWFVTEIEKEGPSAYLGGIASPPDQSAKSNGMLKYVIAWSAQVRADEDYRRVHVMWIKVDPNHFWRHQNWRFALACIGLGIFLAVMLNFIQDYHLLKKEISVFAEKVDRVMIRANNPYVRVNSENEFVFVNKKFLELLGYNNQDELEHAGVGTKRTFRSILTEESQRHYDEVLRSSIRGRYTDAYAITMIRQDRSRIRAFVHGERIVFPALRRKKYPHRFGIVISSEPVIDH